MNSLTPQCINTYNNKQNNFIRKNKTQSIKNASTNKTWRRKSLSIQIDNPSNELSKYGLDDANYFDFMKEMMGIN